MAILAALPFLMLAQLPGAQDPTGMKGAPAYIEIDAGGDGLRQDSTVYADVVFNNGIREQVVFNRGIADNGKAKMKLPMPWLGGKIWISYINLTLTGRRYGSEATDDFDIKNVRVTIKPTTGGEMEMYHKNNINFRLHGVGTWTSNLIEPIQVIVEKDQTNMLYADIYTGDQPLNGGALELGLAVDGQVVWGKSARTLRASPLSHLRVIFTFDKVIQVSHIIELQLRQEGRGFAGFGINGLSIFCKQNFDREPYLVETELTHSMNVNFNMAPGNTWTSSRLNILGPTLIIKGKKGG